MKALRIAFLITCLSPMQGYSECTYFRVSEKLVKCKAMDAKAAQASDPYPVPSDLPEQEAPITQAFIKVDCECQYSLSGSDVRCDTDQALERSSMVNVGNSALACRRGRSLCRDVCPSKLP